MTDCPPQALAAFTINLTDNIQIFLRFQLKEE